MFQIVFHEYLIEHLELIEGEWFFAVFEEGFDKPKVEVGVVGHVGLVEAQVVDGVWREIGD